VSDRPERGRALVGTSGFAHPDRAPRFHPAGPRGATLLHDYAARLPAVELHDTFCQRPTASKVASWLAAVPEPFRFAVTAQRGGAWRALRAGDPTDAVAWLTAPCRLFGGWLGCVLLRVDEAIARDDGALERFLAAWPRELPVAFEFQHPSWEMDEVHALLRGAGACLVATDLDGAPEPPLRRLAPFLYLRLHRTAMTDADLDAWAARLAPFLEDGLDAFVFLRHDADGTSALRAERLLALLRGPAARVR
jgi:uncharacterized protein YecE (DUF72 family)